MRHLNKIIFLNSANIPYAEVALDGNVHFAGTQGVGKSTLLRALLFFYNADKGHIGIQKGQKSFEEFYFRYSNSFIVYEVKTEHSAYSILLSRSQGKAVYRFIDAPYQKEWFIGFDGRVESDWIRIRERIGSNVDISAKIDTYDLYRNIIFGNTHDRSHKFDKYAIVESSKYQNIPRSIQNVFLNTKLDADFVKNTIIQSMLDEDVSINLSVYRSQISEFEREFDEIDCWYKKDSNGEIAVRAKAQKVIESYRKLLAFDLEIRQTWQQLNYAVYQTREQIPLLEDSIKSLLDKLRKIKEKKDSLKAEFDKEHESLIKKIGICDHQLSLIRSKRKHYAEIKINEIIDLNAQEPKYRSEKEQKEKLLQTLQEKFKDVTEKYKALYAALETEKKTFELTQTEELQKYREAIQVERDHCTQSRDSRKKSIDDSFKDWWYKSDERLNFLQEEYNRADKHLSELKFWHPLKKEIEDCQEEIRLLEEKNLKLQNERSLIKSSLEITYREGQSKSDSLKKDFEFKKEEANKELTKLQEELLQTEEILSRWKGSLYEWLSNNKPGWEDNIGKVVDEQQVLYAQGLEPSLSDGGNLFGVSINLDAIPVHHRTPDEYKVLQKEYQDSISAKKRELSDLQKQLEQDLDSLNKSYKTKIQDLQQQETNLAIQISQIPLSIKDAETRLHQHERKEQELINEESERRNSVFNTALLNKEKEQADRKLQNNKHDRELKSVDADFKKSITELQKRFNTFKQEQDAELAMFKKDMSERQQLIESQERDELKGKGADTRAIELCRIDIINVQKILKQIDDQRHFVIEYRKDDDELFSHESEFRDEKASLESKDKSAQQTYNNKNERFETEISGCSNELKDQEAKLSSMKDGLKQYEQLCTIEHIIPDSLLMDDSVIKNGTSCRDLVPLMRGAIHKKRQAYGELKSNTNSFNTHFGTNNTFHFIVPQNDEEYMEFALNLQDFIMNDKIEDYRVRLNEHYNTILRSVSREVGFLMNHSAEIKGIINDINHDFQERNFAGVIRSIELKVEESSDRMMILLRSIRDFTEENSLSLGEMNLFSDTNRDLVNEKVVDYLKKFMKQLLKEPSRNELTLSDTFRLQFRVQENDNNTGWVEHINNVGSDGTDILVKAMVNIMLINVFKNKATRKNGDFVIHCMMDEIGKLHPSNVKGILKFANERNIYLINSSPMSYNADIYKYNYLLTKDGKSQTHVKRLLTINR